MKKEEKEENLDFGHDAWIILDTGGVHVDDSVNTAGVVHGKPETSEIHQNSLNYAAEINDETG